MSLVVAFKMLYELFKRDIITNKFCYDIIRIKYLKGSIVENK